jgi:hypothetical protein
MIRAKFRLDGIRTTSQPTYDGSPEKGWKKVGEHKLYDLDFSPVTATSPENKAFWEATPSGKITLSVINESAAQAFLDHLGKEWFVDFSPA